MKNLLILLSILLLGGLFATAHAQLANVVINEIDTNPPGNDAKSINEWIELYNPTNSKIDIGGWQIASTTILKKTMTIHSGTFIEPGQFLTFTYQSLWFTDSNELVELKDKNGTSVDSTPLLSDMKNNFYSWQRIHDGYDLNALGDWKFAISTTGASNGKLIVAEEKENVTVSVSMNKLSYLLGDTAVIKGTVSKQISLLKPYFHPDKIIIKISGLNFDKTISLYPDLNLNYSTTLNLQQVLGINKGDYSVLVRYGGATSQSTFSVGNEIMAEKIKDDITFNLTIDKTKYIPGNVLSLTGFTSKIIPLEALKFTLKNPSGKIISTGSLYPTNGTFSTKVFLSMVNPVYGKYQIVGEYSDKSTLVSFEMIKDIKENKAISLWTDKEGYNLGETAVITGRLNNIWVNFVNLEIIQTKNTALVTNSLGDSDSGFKILDSIKIAGDGSFTYSFKIPNDKIRLGDYRISVLTTAGSTSKIIHAVTNATNYLANTEPISLSTDKTVYDLGDGMTINGVIANPATSSVFLTSTVKISILHADGRPLEFIVQKSASEGFSKTATTKYVLTAIPDASGRFSVQTNIVKNLFAEGSYKIKAEYRGLTKTIPIGIVDPLKLDNVASFYLDKQVYGLGETVALTGLLPPSGATSVTISLTKPDGSTLGSGATVQNQQFSWSWIAPITEKPQSLKLEDRSASKSNYGIYKITISTDSFSKDVFFKISANPKNDSLTLAPMSVSTEKSLYKSGEKLTVTGNIIKREQGSKGLVVPDRVTILVIDGKFPFKQIHQVSVYPDGIGNFNSVFELPVTLFSEGNYKVKALYLGKQIETTFTITNNFSLGSADKLSLLLTLDKSEYYPGDIVTISGKPNKLIYLEKFDVSISQKKVGEITCGSYFCGIHSGSITSIRPSSSGSFLHEFQLSDSLSSLGSYEITVDAGFETKSIKFNVVEKPVIPVSKKSLKIITEKVNRILEDKISIITNTKTINNNSALPKAISGSLITAKIDQPSVNLRVTSDSGICIIGPEISCLVKESTEKVGKIYQIVSVNGIDLKVRYTGPNSYPEKFDILPESPTAFLPNTNWNVNVIKNDQESKFYYTINYQVLE